MDAHQKVIPIIGIRIPQHGRPTGKTDPCRRMTIALEPDILDALALASANFTFSTNVILKPSTLAAMVVRDWVVGQRLSGKSGKPGKRGKAA